MDHPHPSTLAVLSDWHIPHHDPAAVAVALRIVTDVQPTDIVLAGDLLDAYTLSSFDKDPGRLASLQDELDAATSLLASLRALAPDSTITFVPGNHEQRLSRHLKRHPELHGLHALTWPSLLSLDSLNIRAIPEDTVHTWHGMVVEHGTLIRRHSAYTSRAQIEQRGVSGISGHTHRLGTHYLTNMAGAHVWIENGCLARLDPEYVFGTPNWQQGFSVLTATDGPPAVEQVHIHDGHATFRGHTY
jgi:predicted phosphodiesterase